MKSEPIDPDVSAVMKEEKSRGRRITDEEQRALQQKFKRDFERLLKNGNEKQFRAFLIVHEQREGSEQFERSLKLWQAYQQKYGKT